MLVQDIQQSIVITCTIIKHIEKKPKINSKWEFNERDKKIVYNNIQSLKALIW